MASAVLMVKPVDFGYNVETALDNEFMHKINEDAERIKIEAIAEFEESVRRLREAGVTVVVHDKFKHRNLERIFTPDAVFPNNWFASDGAGNV